MASSDQYVKLEERLVLLAWLNSLFGYKSNREMLRDTQEVAEGFDGEGRSFMYYHLVARGEKLKINPEALTRYDDNIKAHLDAMNKSRAEPITLRYFQYLSVLYTEVFLDWYFRHPGELLRELNRFVTERNANKAPGDVPDPYFDEGNFTKLAFWMATGSGKTLIMHFNYRQFLHYNTKPLDNILLITPNEGLTVQHIDEMKESDIPCERFNIEESGFRFVGQDPVRVIEITKLVEEKRGGGVSVDVESFEGNNLIFVDEGHKGTGGEVWRGFRDRLGQTGFTFEYSATFGQALTASKRDELTAEYGKAIVFDYSYKYFYEDGYGKDFHILNLREDTTVDQTDTLLLANLLSFYEQKSCFAEQFETLKPYNLEMPLWTFVGSRVTAVYTKGGQKRSDVLTVVRFLHRFLNKPDWATRTIEKVIQGRTGLHEIYGSDIFADKFDYLRQRKLDGTGLYNDVLSTVFHVPAGGGLHMADIRGSSGELGLKVGGATDYFGLIYIGDTPKFKSLVEADDSGIILEEDTITRTLFEHIHRPDSKINILIGAKKFMEGWNSWRVSNMGLLNIGRKEGSEIIQLFGRGVRLRGLNSSLKRSSVVDGEHPAHISLLEMLNIFAVRANYMAQFRDYLEREGIETEGYFNLPLPIKPNEEFLDQNLFVPKVPPGRVFAKEYDFLLKPDSAAKITVDMSLKVDSMRSSANGLTTTALRAGQERVIPPLSLELLDWEAIYLETLEYKEQRGFHNLVVRLDDLKNIITENDPRLYFLIADDEVTNPRSFAGVSRLHEAVLSIFRKYIDRLYRVHHKRWDSENMVCEVIKLDDSNFEGYTIQLPRSEAELIEAVKALVAEGERIYKEGTRELPNIYFDRHLYQPLLAEAGDKIKSTPKGLNDSEKQFVDDIRKYSREEADKSLANKVIFLLRNQSRGKGIGFFGDEGFYPDFILWIKEGEKQRIVFVEPHGMRQTPAYKHDDKARLHEWLKEFSAKASKRSGLEGVTLDSFLISTTPYDELRKLYEDGGWDCSRFADAHILFLERNEKYDYFDYLFAE